VVLSAPHRGATPGWSAFSSAVPAKSGHHDDDRVRDPVAGARAGRRRRPDQRVRLMWAHPAFPRRGRNAILPGEPRRRCRSRLHLPNRSVDRRNRTGTQEQRGTAIRCAHVRPRQVQRKVILPVTGQERRWRGDDLVATCNGPAVSLRRLCGVSAVLGGVSASAPRWRSHPRSPGGCRT
jgi:hypothetical protein